MLLQVLMLPHAIVVDADAIVTIPTTTAAATTTATLCTQSTEPGFECMADVTEKLQVRFMFCAFSQGNKLGWP